MQLSADKLKMLILIANVVIVIMALLILLVVYLHRKKMMSHLQIIKQLEVNYEKNILKTQLEIQEQTFQNISREIHDNITLSLTLAKLHLHTLPENDPDALRQKVQHSIELLTKSIGELSDISKGLNADIIIQHGLLKAVEEELERIRQTGLFTLEYEVEGTPVYMDNQKELIIFRIIQESFNNIIKHARASVAGLLLHFTVEMLQITITDNGRGFDTELSAQSRQAGLKNMDTRVRILNGSMQVESTPGQGTRIIFTIPITNHAK